MPVGSDRLSNLPQPEVRGHERLALAERVAVGGPQGLGRAQQPRHGRLDIRRCEFVS